MKNGKSNPTVKKSKPNLSSPKGNIMTKLNGRNAAYMEEINAEIEAVRKAK